MKKYIVPIIAASFAVSLSVATADDMSRLEPCAVCHGQTVQGNKALNAPQIAGQDKAYLKEQLINFKNGKRGVHPDNEHGQIMREQTLQLSGVDIEQLAQVLSQMPAIKPVPSKKGDASKGKKIYFENCADCHGEQAQGIASIYAANLAILPDWYLRSQINAYLNNKRGHMGSTTRAKHMRSIAAQLSSKREIEDLIAFLTGPQD